MKRNLIDPKSTRGKASLSVTKRSKLKPPPVIVIDDDSSPSLLPAPSQTADDKLRMHQQTSVLRMIQGFPPPAPISFPTISTSTLTSVSKKTFKKSQEEIKENVPCTYPGCLKSFKRESNMIRHLEGVHGPRNHVCTECDKGFTRAKGLKRHMLIHKTKMPLQEAENISIPVAPAEAYCKRKDGRYSAAYVSVPDVYEKEDPQHDQPPEPTDDNVALALKILKNVSRNLRHFTKQKLDSFRKVWHLMYSSYLIKLTGDKRNKEEITALLLCKYPVEGVTSSNCVHNKYEVLFSAKRLQYLPSHLLSPDTPEGHFTPSPDVVSLYLSATQYYIKRNYSDPRNPKVSTIKGPALRALIRWAKQVIGNFKVESLSYVEWPLSPSPQAKSIIEEQLKNFPSLVRILNDYNFYKAHLNRSVKLILLSNRPSYTAKRLAKVYVNLEKPVGASNQDLLMCAIYCGIASLFNAGLRNNDHQRNIQHETAPHNARLYKVFKESLNNGRDLLSFGILANFLLSRSTAHLIELAVISFLHLLTPNFNTMRGNKRVIECSVGKALPLQILQEVGLTLLLEGWHSFAAGAGSVAPPWMQATAVPPEGPILPLRFRLQLKEQMETEAEETDEEDDENEDEFWSFDEED